MRSKHPSDAHGVAQEHQEGENKHKEEAKEQREAEINKLTKKATNTVIPAMKVQ